MAPSKVLAEYAKSGAADPHAKAAARPSGRIFGEGSERKSWFHLDCFPAKVGSVDEIVGFSSLKSADKEALNKIKSGASRSYGTKGIKRDNADEAESDESNVKKNLRFRQI